MGSPWYCHQSWFFKLVWLCLLLILHMILSKFVFLFFCNMEYSFNIITVLPFSCVFCCQKKLWLSFYSLDGYHLSIYIQHLLRSITSDKYFVSVLPKAKAYLGSFVSFWCLSTTYCLLKGVYDDKYMIYYNMSFLDHKKV